MIVYVIISWLVSAVSLLIVGQIIPGFEVVSFGSALIAAVVIGLINATVGFFLKIIRSPYRYSRSGYSCL